MAAWWNGLSLLNQMFWGGVVFFSTLFGWQLIASFVGLGGAGDADIDMDADADIDVGPDVDMDGDVGADDGSFAEDAGGLATFRLLSVRSILAFGTLFTWAGALYLQEGGKVVNSLLIAATWGVAGMLVVAGFYWLLPRLTEEGNLKLSETIGKTATVYIRISASGTGQVRVLADNRVSYLKARSGDGRDYVAGQSVIVGSVGSDGVLVVSSADVEINQGEYNG